MFKLIINICFAVIISLFMLVGIIENILLYLSNILKVKLKEIKRKSYE